MTAELMLVAPKPANNPLYALQCWNEKGGRHPGFLMVWPIFLRTY